MHAPSSDFFDEELPIPALGGTTFLTLRHPQKPCDAPSLLLNLALDRKSTLNQQPYCLPTEMLVAAGHYAASFDLPNHGDNINEYGAKLDGMAASIAAGVDVFAMIRETAQRALTACANTGVARFNRIVVTGTSRGGLAALHVMAEIPQIAAAAVFAPVTALSFLIEFAHLADLPITRNSNAEALIPRLQNRPILISIGPDDQRVGTANCRRFHAQLASVGEPNPPVLHIDTHAQGHRTSDSAYRRGAAFLLSQVCET